MILKSFSRVIIFIPFFMYLKGRFLLVYLNTNLQKTSFLARNLDLLQKVS